MRTVGVLALGVVASAASAAGGAWWASRPAPAVERPSWHAEVEALRASAEGGSLRAGALALLDASEDEVVLAEATTLLGFVAAPEDAQLLASLALARDPVLTEPAIQALGRLGTDEAVDHLIRLVDGPRDSRGSAVVALGRSRHPLAVDRVTALLHDPELAGHAAWGLAAHGGPEASEALVTALEDTDPPYLAGVAHALARLAATEPSADQALRRHLSGPRTPRRAAVLTALAEVGDPTVFGALVADLREGTVPIAVAAAHALGTLRDPRAVPALARAADVAPAEVCRAALAALARHDSPDATSALLHLVASAPAPLAAEAAAHLSDRALSDPEVVARLVEAVGTRPTEVRTAAMRTLFSAPWPRSGAPEPVLALARSALEATDAERWGVDPVSVLLRYGTPEDLEHVERLVRSGPGPVRRHLGWTLEQVPGPRGEFLLSLLADDPDPNVHGPALRALLSRGAVEVAEERLLDQLGEGVTSYGTTEQLLVQIGSDRALDAVFARVTAGTRREAGDAVRALASSGSREHVDRLLGVADRTDDPQLRQEVLQSVVHAPTVDPELIVERALGSDDPQLASVAVQALVRIGTPEARARLVELAASDDLMARMQALGALSQVGGPEAEEALLEGLHDPEVAWQAVSGLEQLGTERAREALLGAARSEDADPQVRASVMHQVPRLLGPEGPDLLADIARDPDESVRSAAVGALESVGSSQAAEALAKLLVDPEATDADRMQVATALQRMGGPIAAREEAAIAAIVPAPVDTGL